MDPRNVEIDDKTVVNGLCFSFTTKEGSLRILGTAKRKWWREGESNSDSRDQVSVFLQQSSLVFFLNHDHNLSQDEFFFYKKLLCGGPNYFSHVKT